MMEIQEPQEVAPAPPEVASTPIPVKPSTSNDEKAPDSSDATAQQKPKVPKAKKRKKPRDSTAPRHPLTGLFTKIR